MNIYHKQLVTSKQIARSFLVSDVLICHSSHCCRRLLVKSYFKCIKYILLFMSVMFQYSVRMDIC